MTTEELAALLADKPKEWRAGFFKAVNLTPATKAAFLREMIGQLVVVEEGCMVTREKKPK